MIQKLSVPGEVSDSRPSAFTLHSYEVLIAACCMPTLA